MGGGLGGSAKEVREDGAFGRTIFHLGFNLTCYKVQKNSSQARYSKYHNENYVFSKTSVYQVNIDSLHTYSM